MIDNDFVEWISRGPMRRYLILPAGGLIIILIFGIPAVLLGYVYIGFSPDFTALLISAFGALSTSLLVGVTFVTFVENQLLTMKRQQRPLVREELQEVILPSVYVLRENISRLSDGSVDWRRFDIEDTRTYAGFRMSDLKPLRGRAENDAIVFNRFLEKHPELAVQVVDHDERLARLSAQGRDLVSTLVEPLREHIQGNEIHVKKDRNAKPEYVADFVLNEVDELDDSHTHQEVWATHKDGFRSIAEEVLGDEFGAFLRSMKEYQEVARGLIEEFEQVRDELQREYTISIYESTEREEDLLE